MKKLLPVVLAGLAVTFTLGACSQKSEAPKPAEATPAVQAPAQMPGQAPAGMVPDRGLVAETMDGDGNTYIRIEAGGTSFWFAAPQTAVNVGEVLILKNPTLKAGYKSAALNKDFGNIYFVTGVAPLDTQSAHQKIAGPAIEVKNVQKLSGGYTVSELYSKKDSLAEKEVSLRAKVVKFSGGIMGTNWMHLRDGTGDDKSNDLTITSQAAAKPGDTVVVKGVLKKDVDIGSGYFFPLIIRDAQVKAE